MSRETPSAATGAHSTSPQDILYEGLLSCRKRRLSMRAWKYALLIPLAVGLLTAAYERTHTDQLMVDAAKNYLASLNADQRKLTSFALDNMDERTHWLYTPF